MPPEWSDVTTDLYQTFVTYKNKDGTRTRLFALETRLPPKVVWIKMFIQALDDGSLE